MSIFNPKFKDTDFMSELEAAHHMRPNKAAIGLFLSIIALVTCTFFWMAHSKVEEITRAQGSVVPSQDIQVVQSLDYNQSMASQLWDKLRAGNDIIQLCCVGFEICIPDVRYPKFEVIQFGKEENNHS